MQQDKAESQKLQNKTGSEESRHWMVLAHGSIYLKWHQYKVAQKEHQI